MKKLNKKRIIILISVCAFIIIIIFMGNKKISDKIIKYCENSNSVLVNYQNSFFQDFCVEDNVVKIRCHLVLINITDKEEKFYIRAKSPIDVVGGLLTNEDLHIKDDINEKIFTLEPEETNSIDVVFEGEYGGTYQKVDRLLPSIIEIVILK